MNASILGTNLLQTRRRELGLFALIVVVSLAVGWIDRGFLRGGNWRDLAVRASPTAIIACGVTLVVLTGEIDISVGSLLALLATVIGLTMSRNHGGWPIGGGVLITLALGAAVGFMTGVIVTVGRVPSMIVTLGSLTALRGLTILAMRGENIGGLPDSLQQWTKVGWFGWPLGVWAAAGVISLTACLLRCTPLGWRLYAVGSSAYAAQLRGLPERRLKQFAFTYTGFLTAVAALVEVPRLPKIEAGVGAELELLVVTCVVLGGVAIAGGRGNLLGVILATVLMTMVRPVLTFLDVGESGEKWTKAIQGLFILAALLSDRGWGGWWRRPADKEQAA